MRKEREGRGGERREGREGGKRGKGERERLAIHLAAECEGIG